MAMMDGILNRMRKVKKTAGIVYKAQETASGLARIIHEGESLGPGRDLGVSFSGPDRGGA